jgi:drug/metabolite transporter (DMT)-like permease
MNKKHIGILIILGASIMWAIEPVFAKLSFETSDFLQTSTVRAIVVSIIALFYLICINRKERKLTKKKFIATLYLAVFGTLIADLLYFLALANIPVINAVLIGHMQPIFIIFIGFFVLKEEKLTKFDYIGISAMLGAGILVTSKTMANLSVLKFGTWGDLVVLVATFMWATTAIVMKKFLKEINAGTITFFRFIIASIVLSIYTLGTSGMFIKNYYQILVGIVVGIGTILYYEGMKRIKVAQVSSIELATPFFAAVLGIIVLNEMITPMQMLGMILLFFGIYHLSRREENNY